MQEMRKYKNQLIAAGKLLVTVFILVLVLRQLDLHQLRDVLSAIHYVLLVPVTLLYAFSKWLSHRRLLMVLHAADIPIEAGANFRLYLLGMYYNLLLPGGVGGDGYKVYLMNKKWGIGTKKLVGLLLADRIIGMIALLFVCLILMGFVPLLIEWSWAWIILVPMGFYTGLWMARKWKKELVRNYPLLIGYSILVQLAQLMAVFLLIIALGVDFGFVGYLVLFLVSAVTSSLPISFGGTGVREMTFYYGANLLGLDASIAVAISLLFYLVSVMVSLSGGYYSFNSNALRLEST